MIRPIADTWTIILTLTAINVLFFLVVKTNKRFYFGQIILFAITLAMFLAWDNFVFPHYKSKIKSERNADTIKNKGPLSNEVWLSTKKTEDIIYSLNRPTFEAGGFQTILTFLFSLFGLKMRPEQKLFRRTSILFGILSVLFLIIYFIASIAPTGMVT